MASWLGYASLTWTASPNSVSLPLKHSDGNDGDLTHARSLLSLCTAVTPACFLNPFLPGGDAQTIYAAIKTSGPPSVKLHYKRKLFESDSIQYPGTFAVDFVSRHPAGKDVRTVNPRTTLFEAQEWERFERTGCIDAEDEAAHDERDRPILIALHGISGGSHELYVREVLDPLINGRRVVPGGVDAEDERGILAWDCLVVNARGCANSPVTTDRLFNARASWDVRQVVAWLHQAFPRRRLFAVGFSLGGNILTNVSKLPVRQPFCVVFWQDLIRADRNPCPSSTWAKRAVRPLYLRPSYVRAHGTSRRAISICKGPGWVGRYTPRHSGPI